MVFIGLTALQTTLLVTFLVVAAELIAVSISYTLLRVFETSTLQHGGAVSLHLHRRRLKVFAMAFTLSFVALETFFSLSSSTDFKQIEARHPCIRLIPRLGSGSPPVDAELHKTEARVILDKCRSLNGTMSHQALGNFSQSSSQVSCTDGPVFSYNTSERIPRSPSNAMKECGELAESGSSADSTSNERRKVTIVCVFYDYVDDTFYFTPDFFSKDRTEETPFVPSKLSFNVSESLMRDIAARLFQFYFSGVSGVDDSMRRRIAFTNLVLQDCLFPIDEKEGTNVPVYVIIVFVVLGVLLLFTYILAVCLSRKRKLIDLSNPFIWTQNYEGVNESQKVKVEMNQEDGKLFTSDFPKRQHGNHANASEEPQVQ